MRHTCIALIALASCALALAQRPARVTIGTDPLPSAVNMLINPGFEEGVGEDGAPVGWRVNTAAPEDFIFEPTDGRVGEVGWRVHADSPAMSGYLQQNVAVEDDVQYRAWTWLRLRGGRYMMLLRGLVNPPDGAPYRFDERTDTISTKNHWLAPLYLNPAHLQGPPADEWILMPMTIAAPAGLGNVQVWIGSYFTASEMHFDDTFFGPANCTVTMTIASDSPIRKVRLMDLTSGRPIFRDDAAGGVATWERAIPEMPIADAYRVTVATDAGEQTQLVLANQ